MQKLKILFISSRPPYHSAGLANDMMNALITGGHEVDFLTLFDFEGRKGNQYFVLKELTWQYKLVNRLRRIPDVLKYGKIALRNRIKRDGRMFPCLREDKPFVDKRMVVNSIQKKYDVVVTLFWQDMITTCTLKAIYDKLQCPVIIRSVDMYTFTGGCYYFSDCRNFEHECGKCPVLNSNDPNDQSHKNFLLKKKMYSSINYVIGLNTWMKSFANRTGMLEERRIINTCAIIDEEKFFLKDKMQSRKLFNIPENKKVVLFARFFEEGRKGFSYLKDALDVFYEMISPEDREEVLLLFAGSSILPIKNQLKFESVDAGYLNTEYLINAYNAASVFLSPSIDDAGPSMVNQSIMCGTPVIAFNIGTAIDVIEEGISGWRVETGNTKEYAKAICDLFKMPEANYLKLKSNCRKKALQTSSKQSFVKMVESSYELLMQNNKE